MTKTCTKCHATASGAAEIAAMFYPRTRKGKPAGYRETCKQCSKAAASEYQALHPEKQDKWRTWNARKRAAQETQGDASAHVQS